MCFALILIDIIDSVLHISYFCYSYFFLGGGGGGELHWTPFSSLLMLKCLSGVSMFFSVPFSVSFVIEFDDLFLFRTSESVNIYQGRDACSDTM